MLSRVSRAAVVTHLDAGRRWHIVLARDRRFDGAFVYAVRSTGIYCRPSCPSKRPRRGQVLFFLVPEGAERAGFRPCRRCRPGAANGPDPRVEAVGRACQLIDAHPDAPAGLATLAARGPLGGLRGAAPEGGCCGVGLGDDARALERAPRAEFPAATIVGDPGTLEGGVTALIAHLDGREHHVDLPLDVRATAFQRRVW